MKTLVLLLFLFGIVSAGEIKTDGTSFIFRAPQKVSSNSRIMILFGGRNWAGEKTLNAYHFDELADKHSLFLLSPSFRDRSYWEPETWSGEALLKAIAELEKLYQLTPQKIYLYGYSAGGQCATLFANWLPERVSAWGAHACGVYPETIHTKAPALLTCGREDSARFQLSQLFLYRYRENRGALLWKPLASGHDLSKDALDLAYAWFDALLSGVSSMQYGEDDTFQIGKRIDEEFRNPLYSDTIRKLWQK